MTEARRVYSTAGGDLRGAIRAEDRAASRVREAGDGVVRVRREKAGRGGKEVTTISGLPGTDADLKALAGDLKRRCGVGGTVRDGVVELQGDHRTRVIERLAQLDIKAKLAGG